MNTNFYYPSIQNDIGECLRDIHDRMQRLEKTVNQLQTTQCQLNKRMQIIHNLFNEYKSDKDTLYDFLNKQLGKINVEMINEQKIYTLEQKIIDMEKNREKESGENDVVSFFF